MILQAFRKLRPPGHGVDSRKIHATLPKKVLGKVSRRIMIRRPAEQRYVPTKKVQKIGPGACLVAFSLDASM